MKTPAVQSNRRAAAAGAFTLVEVMFGVAISSIIATVAMLGLVEGSHFLKSDSSEMVARDLGSRAIRKISTDIQNANQVQIYPNYASTSGSAVTYGSCAVITNTTGSVAYYINPYPTSSTSSIANNGNLYYCANTALGLHPSTDTLLINSIQDFEFRSDVSGSIRTGFKIGTYGYNNYNTGSIESDIVRFTTSDVPRNVP